MSNIQDTGTPLRAEYEQNGYVVARNVIDEALIGEARDHVDWLVAHHPELRPENLGHWLVQHDPFWVRLVSDDRLLDLAEQFIGPNIALFASHYICKPPHDGQAVLWHQDGSYWPLDPMEVITLWLAVDDSTPENGCMRVIPFAFSLTAPPSAFTRATTTSVSAPSTGKKSVKLLKISKIDSNHGFKRSIRESFETNVPRRGGLRRRQQNSVI